MELVDDHDRGLVLGCLIVQAPVVDAEAPQAIHLFNKEHRHGERGGARVDDALRQHLRALLF